MPLQKTMRTQVSQAFRSPHVMIGLAGIIIYALFITDGTFNFLDGDNLSLAYNYYLLAIMNGRLDIPQNIIGYEGFYDTYGRAYTYFGILPALFRLFFWPFVNLQEVKVGHAFVFVLAVSSALLAQSLLLRISKAFPSKNKERDLWLIMASLSVWFASPLSFLMANSSIYQETILTGIFLTITYIYIFTDQVLIKRKVSAAGFLGLSLIAALAEHARPHVALALYAGTCLLKLLLYFEKMKTAASWSPVIKSQALTYAIPLLVMMASGILFLMLNYARWGDYLNPAPLDRWAHYLQRTHFSQEVETYFDMGRFNIRRFLPILAFSFTGSMPLFTLLQNVFDAGFIRLEAPNSPILIMWPLWIWTMFYLIAALCKKQSRSEFFSVTADRFAPMLILGLTLLIIFFFVATFGIVTTRYRAEMWPLLFFSGLLFFAKFDFFFERSHFMKDKQIK
jgi:hypothetical protein